MADNDNSTLPLLRLAFRKSLELHLTGIKGSKSRHEALQEAGQRLMQHLQHAPATSEGVMPSVGQNAILAAQLQEAINELTAALQDR